MIPLTIADNTRRLLAAVRKLERTLHTAGLPRCLAFLPMWWLCWHYCRILDQKIARIGRIDSKFVHWLAAIRQVDHDSPAHLELIDLDHSMRDDIESTKHTLWELRSHCIDIHRMFEQLGSHSLRLKRRHADFLQVLENACVSASTMQQALTTHDASVLKQLRSRQLEERAAFGSAV